MNFKEYASKEYALQKKWDTSNIGKVIAINNDGVAEPCQFLSSLTVSPLIMLDVKTGNEYSVYIENGALVVKPIIRGIEIIENPVKLKYFIGENFDPSGMRVGVRMNDGSLVEINDYTYPEKITTTDNIVKIQYISAFGNIYTANLVIDITYTTKIEVTQMPNKISYYDIEAFDPTGMIVTAVFSDGSFKEINNYTYEMDLDNSLVIIQYIESGNVYTTAIDINVTFLNIALQDFQYTKNADGTYTLTKWKGTYNGVSSTKMVVPDIDVINI